MRARFSARFRAFLPPPRRTRVLRQDPQHREVIYAGTTEGLYKTVNGGKTFKRTTGPDVIVNDVYVDPTETDRVLMATDRGGVQLSTDGGASFVALNKGFSERKVEALLVDRDDASAPLCWSGERQVVRQRLCLGR